MQPPDYQPSTCIAHVLLRRPLRSKNILNGWMYIMIYPRIVLQLVLELDLSIVRLGATLPPRSKA
jgi:hypothetical protein